MTDKLAQYANELRYVNPLSVVAKGIPISETHTIGLVRLANTKIGTFHFDGITWTFSMNSGVVRLSQPFYCGYPQDAGINRNRGVELPRTLSDAKEIYFGPRRFFEGLPEVMARYSGPRDVIVLSAEFVEGKILDDKRKAQLKVLTDIVVKECVRMTRSDSAAKTDRVIAPYPQCMNELAHDLHKPILSYDLKREKAVAMPNMKGHEIRPGKRYYKSIGSGELT